MLTAPTCAHFWKTCSAIGLLGLMTLGNFVAAVEKKPKSTVADPGTTGDGNFILGPTYTPAPEMSTKEGVPKGKIHKFTMESTDSKIYPGIKGP